MRYMVDLKFSFLSVINRGLFLFISQQLKKLHKKRVKPIKNNVQHYEKVEIKTAKLRTKVIKSTNLNAFVTIIKYLLPRFGGPIYIFIIFKNQYYN